MAPNNAMAKSALGDEADDAPRGVVSRDEVRARGDGVNEGARPMDGSLGGAELRRLLVAVMFLTRLPCPRWVDHAPVDLVPGMAYFAPIGSAVGLWVALWRSALATVLPPLVAAAGATLMGVWVTGCFHEDGLADTLDAFGGGWGRAQILRIMKDSRVGTYAVVGVCLCMIARTALICELGDAQATLTGLVVAHTLSRLTSLWLVKLFPYVHDEGDDKGLLYNSFAGCLKAGLLTWPRVVASTAYAAALCAVLLPAGQAVRVGVLVAAVVPAAGHYATGVIGGVIGDYLGAVIMLSELGVYMALQARVPDQFWADADFVLPWIKLAAVAVLPAAMMRGAGELPEASKAD